MARKKILVDIYLAKNLGDDLFLDHLSHSFPHIDFVPFYPGKNYASFFEHYENIQQFSYTIVDKIAARLGMNKLTDFEGLSKTYDGLLFLGGGIFREESYWKELYEYRTKIIEAFKYQGKKIFFSGCNFGPFQTANFANAHYVLFQKVNQLIFRDKKSYGLFSHLKNIVYAPDLIWSYDLPESNRKEKVLGISVIDPQHKQRGDNTYDEYITAHQELCEKYLKEGYQIKLFSFCEAEGDWEIAKKIANSSPEIEILNYTTDITNYLKEIGSCSRFVAARFHAVIIAFKYGIPVVPVVYGDKTENLLTDLGFESPFVDLASIRKVNSTEFLTMSTAPIEQLYKEGKKHFDIHY